MIVLLSLQERERRLLGDDRNLTPCSGFTSRVIPISSVSTEVTKTFFRKPCCCTYLKQVKHVAMNVHAWEFGYY